MNWESFEIEMKVDRHEGDISNRSPELILYGYNDLVQGYVSIKEDTILANPHVFEVLLEDLKSRLVEELTEAGGH